MTQQHASSPDIIYQILTEDTEFMELVGTRIFKTGNTELDSISIATPGELLPAIKSQTGLEVIIHDIGQLNRREYITNDIDITAAWKVFLLAWPGANGTTLNNAARRIMQLFSKATTLEINTLPTGLGAMAQLLVLIPSDSLVLVQ
jgi:hypothetical protein